jgi:hypothetical protein
VGAKAGDSRIPVPFALDFGSTAYMGNTPLLIVEIALGLGFLVNITLAIVDLLDANRLNAKGKLKGADISH